MDFFIGFLIIWLPCCIGVGVLADSRGRSGFGYFLLSLFFSPLIGLMIVLVTNNVKEEDAKELRRKREQESREYDRKREHEKQLESLRALAASNQIAAKGPEAATASSIANEIEKLASLLARGLLTQQEFEDQKRDLLQKPSSQTGGTRLGKTLGN